LIFKFYCLLLAVVSVVSRQVFRLPLLMYARKCTADKAATITTCRFLK